MQRYSIFALARNALSGHEQWQPAWRSPEPRPAYDVVIVGAGGHGLATAYYLAKEHGVTNVAVLEKGWLGGGNTGRNTTICRSNYLYDESAALYDHALKLWEGLTHELNYNVMFSPRGVMMLAHTVHDMQSAQRHIHANRLNGVDNEWLTAEARPRPSARRSRCGRRCATRCWAPPCSAAAAPPGTTRWPGATPVRPTAWASTSSRTARSPASAARATASPASRPPGASSAPSRSASSTAGHTSVVMQMAGLRMPLESVPLQALVSEPVKPCFPCVVMSNTIHAYISQSDKGELVIGAGSDQYISYAQRGSFQVIEHTLEAICELFPIFRRMRMLRQWAGIVDVTADRSPIIGKTPVQGLYVNCGWGTGGFKATPGSGHVFAHTIATGEPHPIAAPFSLDRFTTGRLIDEAAAAAVAH